MVRRVFEFIIASLFALSISYSCVRAPISLPQDWAIPPNVELKGEWRKESPNGYGFLKADFNGDGIMDQAYILIRKDNRRIGIFAFVSQKDKKSRTFMLEEMDYRDLEDAAIKVVPPGQYVTWCGKGARDCLQGEPERIFLPYSAIELFFIGKSSRYFYWDDSHNRFKSVWMID
jgi:hypothetical protein